jgi:hypothetical protein
MPVPSIREVLNDNLQLTRIARLKLSPEDEQTYKSALESAYLQTIDALVVGQVQPAMVPVLRAELTALRTLSTEQLAALPERQPPPANTGSLDELIAAKTAEVESVAGGG